MDLKARLDNIPLTNLAAEFAEIDVLVGWEHLPDRAFNRVLEIADAIPEPACRHR